MVRRGFQPSILLTLFVAACASPVVPTSAPPSISAPPTASAAPAPSTIPPPTLAATPLSTPSATTTVVETPSGLGCTSEDPALVTAGQLTVGFSEPAVPPWFVGDAAIAYPGEPEGTAWEVSDPYSGEGFEGALAHAVAAQLGFARENVQWLVVDRASALASGPKPFDMYISQAPSLPVTAGNATSTRAYLELNDAVVGLFADPIAEVTTVAELRTFSFGAVTATSGEVLIRQLIQPNLAPSTYPDLEAAISALELDDVDGLVVDLATAFRLRDEVIPGAVVVGQFDVTDADLGIVPSVPTGYAIALPGTGALSVCISAAVDALSTGGTLDALRDTWLADRASAPFLE